ncbi:MAG TPA: glycoside hydrolase family 43 protein, partial [Polyangiaceae bacterium]|nr:glycoside hydrolase family 43 protein [Polyangiaceae bacterium]
MLPGTHPDPSVCRVGEDYYLVTSSFEYFPGIPVYHSKDLVHWQLLSHVLTRPSQLDLSGTKSSEGIFAPTIRYHGGTFYVITTNIGGGGSFLVTADDPRGPWSEPIWIRESGFTMDPSLFFEPDGRAYYTRHDGGRRGSIVQAEIDVKTGRLLSDPQRIWAGTGGIWPEGPHLYQHERSYYLLISEGGTSFEHSVTVARADSPWGTFEAAPTNPLLTHRALPDHPVQATGHADLVDTPDGQWFAVLLGIRPSSGRHHHLGRETFLAPVSWEQGWPVINHGQPIELKMSRQGLPASAP